MDVLVTGATGQVGTAILDHCEDHRFTLLDRQPPSKEYDEYEFHEADVTDATAVRSALEGQNAVVHLAANPSVDASWEQVRDVNIAGTRTVLESARQKGVDQVVYASSNHVQGMYERDNAPEIYGPDLNLTIDHTDPVRPDSYYGTGKVTGEALGRQYVECSEKPPSQFHALRICSVRNSTDDHPYGDAERTVDDGLIERHSEDYERSVARMCAMWHSRRDLAGLVERCLAHEESGFDVFYGVSDNDARWFDLSHAREVIGYEPLDSAEDWDEPP